MKRGNNLDFTPLLDVIMILLFVILAGIGRRAAVTRAELTEAEIRIAELDESREALEESVGLLEESVALLEEQNRVMTEQFDEISQQYGDLRAITEYDRDHLYAYPAVLRRVTKLTLVCMPEEDIHTGDWSVHVDLYMDNDYDNDLVYLGTHTLIHDYELTQEQRRLLTARQELETTGFLSQYLEQDVTEYCYVTIQYPVNDAHFSSIDLDILEKSVNNTQSRLGLRCYIERAGIF